jgi:hypothetical protein
MGRAKRDRLIGLRSSTLPLVALASRAFASLDSIGALTMTSCGLARRAQARGGCWRLHATSYQTLGSAEFALSESKINRQS